MTHIFGLDADTRGHAVDQQRLEGQRIARAPFVVALEVERIAVELVGAALGHSVGHATRRATIFGRVIRGVDLEFTNRRLADRVIDARTATFFREESWLLSPPSIVLLFSKPEMPRKLIKPKVPSGTEPGVSMAKVRPAASIDR
jgi:hypothetical protein